MKIDELEAKIERHEENERFLLKRLDKSDSKIEGLNAVVDNDLKEVEE